MRNDMIDPIGEIKKSIILITRHRGRKCWWFHRIIWNPEIYIAERMVESRHRFWYFQIGYCANCHVAKHRWVGAAATQNHPENVKVG